MKNVLVVDDTKNIRVLLTKCLELEGYNVTTASDGQQALELFKNNKFDLAFLDIKMPHLSGTEVLKRIRETGIEIPVIIITAYATIKNAVECTQMGAVAYLQKPFTAEKVRATLNELMNVSCTGVNASNINVLISQIEDAINTRLYEKSLEMLKRAISIEPTNKEIYFLFSRVYHNMGDNSNANKFCDIYNILKSK